MKKAISFITVLIMLFACSMPAFAADGEDAADKGTLFDYRFRIFSREEAKEIALEIAKNSIYEPLFLEPDIQSVIVCVDLRANPELSNPAIFVPAVREMIIRANDYISDPVRRTVLMSETRLAGELALHIAGLMFIDRLNSLGLIEDDNHLFTVLNFADMNIDEERVPEWLMNITGTILMQIIGFMF